MLVCTALQESLSEADVDSLLHQLWEHKQELAERQREASMELLLHFLQSSRCGARCAALCWAVLCHGTAAAAAALVAEPR